MRQRTALQDGVGGASPIGRAPLGGLGARPGAAALPGDPAGSAGPTGPSPAAATQRSPSLPPRPQSGAWPCLSHGQRPWHPAPHCPERVPGCPHLGRRPGRLVSLSCPRGPEEGCGLHGPLRHRLHNRETRGCGSLGTAPPSPVSPGRSHSEGCLPGGIGPADLAACPQGSWESLPAAGSPRGGHCSSRAQLHIQLQEARAALSLSHRVGGGEDRGCEGAHLPTCRGAASAR